MYTAVPFPPELRVLAQVFTTAAVAFLVVGCSADTVESAAIDAWLQNVETVSSDEPPLVNCRFSQAPNR